MLNCAEIVPSKFLIPVNKVWVSKIPRPWVPATITEPISVTLLGTDASNYTIGLVDNAVISTKNITAVAQNKVYSASTLTDISLNSIELGDTVTGVADFTSRYVANSIAIDISSVVLSEIGRAHV